MLNRHRAFIFQCLKRGTFKMTKLAQWQAREKPQRRKFEGKFVAVEPLNAEKHGDDLFEASTVADADGRFQWLSEYPPLSRAEFNAWLLAKEKSEDPLFFAVINKKSGKAAGRQTLMRIDPENGVVEIGNIYWGPLIARTAAATEAQYLFMQYIFDELGYRRYEWKCNNENIPSRKAAERFGFKFEGVFRQHLIVKGKNRDTAWFSIIDKEWPSLKLGYQQWLSDENFDQNGQQIKKLNDCIKEHAVL